MHIRFSLPLIALFALPSFAASVDDTIAEGRAVLVREEVKAAWDFAEQALAAAPDSAAAHEFVAEVQFRRGDIHAAELEFKKAIEIKPKTPRAWWGMGRVFHCASMRKSSQFYFRKAHDLDPADPDIFLSWAGTLQGKEHVEALRQYLAMGGASLDDEERMALRMHIARDEQRGGRKFAQLASDYSSAEIPLGLSMVSAQRFDGFYVAVSVNGGRPLHLKLDTGASGILITAKAASKAGLERFADAMMGGIGDERKIQTTYIAIADRVKIGKVEFSDFPVEVSDRKVVADSDGLFGTDVFSDFLIRLDFAGRKMRLDPLPNHRPGDEGPFERAITPEFKSFTPVYRFGHGLMITTRVSDSRPVLFLIDTGSATTIIANDFAAEVTKVHKDSSIVVSGVSGRVKDTYEARDFMLQFAGFRQRNSDTLSLDLSRQSKHFGTEISGILGLPLLSLFTLTIDYPDGLVRFEYKSR